MRIDISKLRVGKRKAGFRPKILGFEEREVWKAKFVFAGALDYVSSHEVGSGWKDLDFKNVTSA